MYWLRGLKFSSGVISNTHGYSDCGGEYWRVCIYYSCGQYSHSTYVIVGNSSCGYMTNTAGPMNTLPLFSVVTKNPVWFPSGNSPFWPSSRLCVYMCIYYIYIYIYMY